MITVYIWSFRGKSAAWGHASMAVGREYISWWPETPGQVPSGIHPNVYRSYPIRNRRFQDDIADEGQAPDHRVTIDGLDEPAILNWWASFGLSRGGRPLAGPPEPWSTLRMNCSTVVSTALKLGGGDRCAAWSKSWNLVWTPNDVLQYALSIKNGLASQQAKQ